MNPFYNKYKIDYKHTVNSENIYKNQGSNK